MKIHASKATSTEPMRLLFAAVVLAAIDAVTVITRFLKISHSAENSAPPTPRSREFPALESFLGGTQLAQNGLCLN
jgi:hypothetical protein